MSSAGEKMMSQKLHGFGGDRISEDDGGQWEGIKDR